MGAHPEGAVRQAQSGTALQYDCSTARRRIEQPGSRPRGVTGQRRRTTGTAA